MFLKKFKQTGPDIIILMFIISVLIWAGSFLHPNNFPAQNLNSRPMPLYSILLIPASISPLVNVLIAFILVQLIAFLLVNFNTSDFFIEERTFLPALMYYLISGIFPSGQVLNPLLPGAIFLILASKRIMDAYKVQGTAYTFFDAGLLIGTGSLFYSNLIWFGLLLLIGIAILRTGNIKEIIISVFGLVTPWFLATGILYLAGKDITSLISETASSLFGKNEPHSFTPVSIAVIAVFGALLLISTANLLKSTGARKAKSRKTFSLLIWIFLISAAIFLVVPSVLIEITWLAGIPASYILSNYFVYTKKKLLPQIYFSALLIAVAAVQILNLF